MYKKCGITDSRDIKNDFGDLFDDVQKNHIYRDNKTFSDLVPKISVEQINKLYAQTKNNPKFDLKIFIDEYFNKKNIRVKADKLSLKIPLLQKINLIWDDLIVKSSDSVGSIISLPYPYVVPGGRFTEQYYWDSFFIMLGLKANGRWDLIGGMIKNIAYMIEQFGFVPTANRAYYLSRSQPPFFSYMVKLLAKHNGSHIVIEYLPHLLQEYKYWMNGNNKLLNNTKMEFNHVVKMPNGVILNRYFDKSRTPRSESYKYDINIAADIKKAKLSEFYQNIRAAAESGWDFSSRWFDDPSKIQTIKTINIIPVDLNCLLYQLEKTIADIYKLIGKTSFAKKFELLSKTRRDTIQKYCWDKEKNLFVDYDFKDSKSTSRLTLAAVFPLFTKIATKQQARLVAERLKQDFLKKGGLVTTLANSGQQWDSPNGWAPLQWIAIEGLRNYGHNNLANNIKRRWIKTNIDYLERNGKFVEKYNVIDFSQFCGGGEYVLQDGFGWTNGVLAALLKEKTKGRMHYG